MKQRVVSEHKPAPVPEPGMVSEGGVDTTTGATTGALAGGVIGAQGGPVGLALGALLGGAIGALAAAGPERPYMPEPWLTRQRELTERMKEADDNQAGQT